MNLLIILSAFIIYLTSCSSGEFRTGAKKTVSSKEQNSQNMQPVTQHHSADSTLDSRQFADGSEYLDTQTQGGSGDANGICDKGEINIVIVIDQSDSHSSAELSNVGTGIFSFLSGLEQLKNRYSSLNISTSTVRFYAAAHIGANRWMNFKESDNDALREEITYATSHRKSYTDYNGAISKVSELFQEKNRSSEFVRNYVIFLSDGKPNGGGGNPSSIIPEVTALTASKGTAFITIATKNKAASILQQMANVDVSSPPQHQGQFISSLDQATLMSNFSNLAGDFARLCE